MALSYKEDPQSQDGNACPRNRFRITDYADLQVIETVYTVLRTEELAAKRSSGTFDSAHLRAIHRYLFRDVFPWAGEFRVVNLSKGNAMFAPAQHLSGALEDVLGRLKGESLLAGLRPKVFADRAGYFLGEINAIHPFREGNGRTQREFIRQLAEAAGHSLSWAGFTQAEMIDASIASHTAGDSSRLAGIVERALWSTREGSNA